MEGAVNTKRKKNILMVDDDPFLLALYSKTLEREGYNILTVNDGVAALARISEAQPDLVVLDLMLPQLDGMSVLGKIRADERHNDLPVLILSNSYLPEVAKGAMAAGATAGLRKSECTPRRLVKAIREALDAPKAASTVENKQQAAGPMSWISTLRRGKGGSPEPENPAKPVESTATDSDFKDVTAPPEVQNELQKNWPTEISMIRGACLKFVKAAGTPEAGDHLHESYRRLRLLSARATMVEWYKIGQLSGALEAMIFEHGFTAGKPMSQSVVQTMFQAVDCLEFLLKNGYAKPNPGISKYRLLLVDDDPVCNQANEVAFKQIDFDTVQAGDGSAALKLLENSTFDLILLDIDMPELTGFEVCKRLRQIPHCKETPVIFVTIEETFQTRAQSVLCGGNGMIGKPISPLELIVRTLIFLLRAPNGKVAKEAAVAEKAADKVAPAKKTEGKPAAMPKPAVAPANRSEAAKPDEKTTELKATQAAMEERVKALADALAAETKRRESAEQLAAEHADRQRKLENEHAENQKAREKLQQMLEDSQQKLQTADAGETAKLDGRTRALQAVHDFMEDKSRKLSAKLAEQASQSKTAEEQAAECAKRMGEYESSLAAIRKARENLLRELEASNGAKRAELETAVAENERNQTNLVRQLEETWQEFEAHQIRQAMEPLASQPSAEEIRAQELEAALASVEEKVNSLNEALAAETKRSEGAEQKATEAGQQRSSLEAELAASNEAQAKLRAQLDEQQKKLDAQIQTHQAELGQLAGRTNELELDRAKVEEKVSGLAKALETETQRSESAEQQAKEIAERRSAVEAELAASKEAQARLREQLAAQQKQLEAQTQNHQSELKDQAGRTRELEAGRAAVEEKVRALTDALAAETKRSESAEQKAAEISQRRSTLETELATSNEAQTQLRSQLAAQQQKQQAEIDNHKAELDRLAGRTREIEASRAEVEERVKTLTQSLAAETKKFEGAEKQSADINQRRSALEAELAAGNQAQAQLRAQLAEQQQKLDGQVQSHQAELGNLAARTRELEASRAAVEDKVKTLNQALAAETKRSETAEKQAAEIGERRSCLEAELAASRQSQDQLRSQLAEQQKLLETQVQAGDAEVGKLMARIKELEASCAAQEEKIKSLGLELAAEAKRSEKAEKKADEASLRKNTLEAELAAGNQARKELEAQLAELQKRFDAQVQTHQAELAGLGGQKKDLESGRTELEKKLKALEKSLSAETKRSEVAEQQTGEITLRRNALEAELAASKQAQAQLRTQLAEQQKQLDTQVKTHHAELGNLSGKAHELEASRTAMEEKVKSLAQALAEETKQLEIARRQTSDITERRAGLETELAASNQAQAQLRAELAEHRKESASQIDRLRSELGQTAGQSKELEADRTAAGEKIKSLNQALAAETKRSETAELKVAEMSERGSALEAELATSGQLQAQLRAQLAEQQKQLDVQVQSGHAELDRLNERARQSETARAQAEEKVKSLAEAFAAEARRIESAEQRAASLEQRRGALEAELAASSQAQGQLRTQLAEQQQQLHIVGAELEGFRRCAQEEAKRHTELDQQVAELEKNRASLGNELETARALAASRENAINGLNLELQKHRDAQERLDASLQGEATQRRDLETRVQKFQTQLDDASRQLAQKCMAEQIWIGRESELQTSIREQQDELAKSKAAFASQEVDLKNARIKVEESQILQTVLCAKIQVLTEQNERTGKSVQELEVKAARSGDAGRNLAVVRYAILEASRMSAKLHRERVQKERQNLDAVRQLLSSLVQTPLSMAQRGMLAEVQDSMEGLDATRAGSVPVQSCLVEMPAFNRSEFNLGELIESAFGMVLTSARAAGVEMQASASETASGQAAGFAEHIHQLITLLAAAPLTAMAGINACETRLDLKPGNDQLADLVLRVTLTTDADAQELLACLNTAIGAAGNLQTTSLSEAELGLGAGWQLALAMEAQPTLEAVSANQVCLTVSLPLEKNPRAAANPAPIKMSSARSSGANGSHPARKSKTDSNKTKESCAVAQ